MSRVGKKPILIPQGIEVKIQDGKVFVKGPKGNLEQMVAPVIEVKIENNQILLTPKDNSKKSRALHGLFRSLLANMVTGVKDGFSKILEVEGVGYKIVKSGEKLVLSLGFSHPVEIIPAKGISFEVIGKNEIVVKGIDKCLVGQVAANIRKIKTVEPYKGKGIKYKGEYVRRKAGKVAKATGT